MLTVVSVSVPLPRVTAVARKKSLVILPKVQMAGYSQTRVALHEERDMAHDCVVYNDVSRRQQFHVAPAE